MNKANGYVVAFLVVMAVLSLGVAQCAKVPRMIWRAENGISIGAGANIERQTESQSGTTRDAKSGALGAYRLALSGMSRWGDGLYWEIGYAGSRGSLDYRGNTAYGLPAQARVYQKTGTLSGRLGFVVSPLWSRDRSAVVIPYLGLGWERLASDSVQGALPGGGTRLSGGYYGLGLRADFVMDARWVLSLHGMTGFTHGVEMTSTQAVGFSGATGTVNDASVANALGDGPYTSMGATLIYRMQRGTRLSLRVAHAHWRYGGSAPFVVPGTYSGSVGYERIPGGVVRETQVMLELSRVF